MKADKVNIDKLQTVKNFAVSEGVTASYIYKLVRENKMELIEIDGVKFVQTDTYKTIPVTNTERLNMLSIQTP